MEQNTNKQNEEVNNIEKLDANNITREINLDELYDGAINNTVVIDPVTNSEILIKENKGNLFLIIVLIIGIYALSFYYVYNKTDLLKNMASLEPRTTVTTTTADVINDITTTTSGKISGVLTCSYSSKSDSENGDITFIVNYEDDLITSTNFSYSVISNIDSPSKTVVDLTNQYENYYINNAAIVGNNITFDKNEKGFSFSSEVKYDVVDFNLITQTEGQTILYLKPSSSDTLNSLKTSYENNGFSCTDTRK